ncbi:WG repeat-containing protein [Fibrisoma montanum]|uniref:WG repeat-containing protein n=1 Tax=Fibrisoma montanum TaxID=2305895 RepID=A0A418M8L6_9BACT|nr:WG repeat-containing protein [Fibrisoma montanum]RIV22434.1 WG repeat-containing protein [Fibrisoma montanum]
MKILYVIGAIGLLWMLRYAWTFVRQRTDTGQALSADEQPIIPADALFPVPVKDKWGYINGRKHLVIPPMYTSAADFYDNRAVVQQVVQTPGYSRTYSVIDSAGNVITDQPYDRILDYSEGLAAVRKNDMWGFIDKQGKLVIPCQYEDAGYFSEGLACVKRNGKNGFVDKLGNLVIKPQFERLCYVSAFKEGLAAVYLTHDDGPSGYIDRTGTFAFPPEFSFVEPFTDGLALVRSLKTGFMGFINRKGEWVVPPTNYEDAHSFREGLATVATLSADRKRWQWSVIDKTGKTVANVPQYRSAGVFANGLCAVQNEESRKWGFIDKQGREVIPTRYTGITSIFRNGLARMETGSLFGGLETVYITPKGTVFWHGK